MHAPDDNTAPKGLRGWWASPPRSGMRRVISPWEYRRIVLAGTFAVLARQKTVEVTEAGIAVALGVLLDTVLVRTMLVPATLSALAERAWWPARRAGRRPRWGDGS
jgi:uncharacterized membrane protein YdfJ with MMPL/SSD domain